MIKDGSMKQNSLLVSMLVVFLAFGCGGGGGGGGTKNPPVTPTEEIVKPGVADAQNTAPWKGETTETATGEQLGTAKSRIDGLTQDILVSVVSSGKKNRTDTIEETYPGPVRGYMTYVNTYTFDDVVVGDAFSYTDETTVDFVGYEDVDFGINGKGAFTVSYTQTSLGNSTSTYSGYYALSYKDVTGVYAFYMSYEDISTVVDGVETIESTYEVDGETYTSTAVYQTNGDYTYETTYTYDGITYTSLTSYVGGVTTYETSHIENGVVVIDSSSTSTTSTTVVDGVTTEVYSYTYEENGITYTSTSTTVDGVTTYITSHEENGEVIIDSESMSSYTTTTENGVTTEVYIYVYVEDGITYTSTTTTVDGVTTYLETHEENGVVVVDSSSTSNSTIVDGVETYTYTETYEDGGITYTYTSTTTGDTTTTTTTHLENGVVVQDSSTTSSSSTTNGVTTYTYVEVYVYDGITYTATSTTVDDVTTVVTEWDENGEHYIDTYTY